MNGKQAKKQRQFFKREFAKKYQSKADELAAAQVNVFKTKPNWIPMFLWVWALGFFIKIKR